MKLSTKVGLSTFLIVKFIWWVGGVDVFERTPENAMSILSSMLCGLAAWGFCMVEEADNERS